MFRESSELEDRMLRKQWANTFLFGFGLLFYFASCLTWMWDFRVIVPSSYMSGTATLLMLIGSILLPCLVRRVLTWAAFGLCLISLLIVAAYADYEPIDLATFSLHAASFLFLAIFSEYRASLSRMYDVQEGLFRNRIIEKCQT